MTVPENLLVNDDRRLFNTLFEAIQHFSVEKYKQEVKSYVVKNSRISYINKLKTIYEGSVEDKVFDALLEDRWV